MFSSKLWLTGLAEQLELHANINVQRLASRTAISTALVSSGSSIDYATRLSRILAIKMNQPVYVGCSINFSGTTTEEELEGLMRVVEEVMKVFHSLHA